MHSNLCKYCDSKFRSQKRVFYNIDSMLLASPEIPLNVFWILLGQDFKRNKIKFS